MKDILEVAKERFKRATDAFSETRQTQLEDVRFAHGSPDNNWQWRTEDWKARHSDGRPFLTVNKMPLHIAQVTNDSRQNRPAIKIRPVDDKADVQTAEVFNGIIRHIEAASDSDIAYDMAIDNSVTHGDGYIRVLTDYADQDSFDQEIFIKAVQDSFAVYHDPEAILPDASDANWWFVEAWVGKAEFKSIDADGAANWDFLTNQKDNAGWFDKDKVRIAEYWHKEDYEYKLNLWPDGSLTKGDEGPIPFPGEANPKPVRTRTVKAQKIYCCKLTPTKVLEKKEWAGKYFPFVKVTGNIVRVDGKIYQYGLVRNAKDAQRMYNFWVSQEAEFLGKWTKMPYMAAFEAIEGFENDYQNANRSDKPVLFYNHKDDENNPLPPPTRVQPPTTPAGILAAKAGASEDLKASTGQFDASLGQRSNETSGRAILARQREGDTATFHYIDNLSKAIRQLGRILVDLIPKIYDTERVARVLGEDGEAETAQINPSLEKASVEQRDENGKIKRIYNLGVGKYDVVSTVGPSFTTKRQEALAAMTELVGQNPALWQVIGDLMVKNMDWPGAEDMAKRLKATIPPNVLGDEDEEIPPAVKAQMQQYEQGMEQAGQFIEQLQAQLKELQQGSLAELAKIEKKGDIDAYLKLVDTARDIILKQALPPSADPMEMLSLVMERIDGIAQSLAANNSESFGEMPKEIEQEPMPQEVPAEMPQGMQVEEAPEVVVEAPPEQV